MTIAVLDYGSGNLRSVAQAVRRAGADVHVTGDPAEVASARGLVVPGVGHFGACMRALRERGLDATIKDVIGSGRPVFGVCVGMQVLFEGSDEAPGVAGLGVCEGTVGRLPAAGPKKSSGAVPGTMKVPHMGWNEVRWSDEPSHRYVADIPSTWFYFAHSFAAPAAVPDVVGTVRHGAPFAAAVARDNVFAAQFHPEKSGGSGLALYEAFVRDAER